MEEQTLLPAEIFVAQTGVSIQDNELRDQIIQAGEKDTTAMTVREALKGATAPPVRSALKDW